MDFEMHTSFWLLQDYVPEVGETTRRLEPGYVTVAEAIGADVGAGAGVGAGTATGAGAGAVIPLLVPRDMQDGVLGAYWCRPEAYLDPAVRANCSGLTWPAASGSGATPTWTTFRRSTSGAGWSLLTLAERRNGGAVQRRVERLGR
jgi:hypothetical protein